MAFAKKLQRLNETTPDNLSPSFSAVAVGGNRFDRAWDSFDVWKAEIEKAGLLRPFCFMNRCCLRSLRILVRVQLMQHLFERLLIDQPYPAR